MRLTGIITTMFMLAVFFGVGYQVLTQPKHATAAMAAVTDTITGATHALEGK